MKNNTVKNVKVLVPKYGKYGHARYGKTYALNRKARKINVNKKFYDYDANTKTLTFKDGTFIKGSVSLNTAN